MLSKLLSNRFAMIGIVAVLAIVILLVIQLGSGGSSSTDISSSKEVDTTSTAYTKINDEIIDYDNNNLWKPDEYSRLIDMVDDYLDIDKIDDNQQEKLTDLLIQIHLRLLNDTLIGFCTNAPYGSDISHLENDLKKFENQSISKMEKLVENYHRVHNLIGGVYSYTKSKQHSNASFDSYKKSLEEFIIMDYFIGNESIQEKVEQSIEQLGFHKSKDYNFQAESESYLCDCEEYFDGFQWYIDTCQSIQAIRDGNVQ